MKYLAVIEKTGTGYSAYSPDLEGCVAVGLTIEEVEENMREAVRFHVEEMRAEGIPVPPPSTRSTYVDIPA
jgi:predicted RNase H-like HicB family nuclease